MNLAPTVLRTSELLCGLSSASVLFAQQIIMKLIIEETRQFLEGNKIGLRHPAAGRADNIWIYGGHYEFFETQL